MNVRLVNLHPMCENNTHLLTRATRYFARNGHRLVPRGERADLIVVGGCVVTDGMRARCERRVLELLQAETKAPVIVLGCLGALPERLASGERLQLLGCRDGARLDRLIGAHVPFGEVQAAHLERHLPYLPDLGANNAYVAIAEGCVNACSYCNIKRAKGHVVSRPPEAIEAEVAALRAQGLASVTLLADDCGSYGLDRGLDLAALLLRLAARVPGLNFKVYTVFPALL
ncbi:MAG: radical SAM protein, partial [Acidobacteria bacterium]